VRQQHLLLLRLLGRCLRSQAYWRRQTPAYCPQQQGMHPQQGGCQQQQGLRETQQQQQLLVSVWHPLGSAVLQQQQQQHLQSQGDCRLPAHLLLLSLLLLLLLAQVAVGLPTHTSCV
jgi:hypothetical protein